mgnify:FL=1
MAIIGAQLMKNTQDLSLLIVAFKRIDSLREILRNSLEAGISRIYIVVDLAPTLEGQKQQSLIFEMLEKYKDKFDLFKVYKRDKNVGCAVSVLTGLDWVFAQEKFVCILEDDCIPSLDFFHFVLDSKYLLETDSQLMLTCGTQFAPLEITGGLWIKSSYSLTWGWATTRDKWNILRSDFFAARNKKLRQKGIFSFFKPDSVYWNSGARRALEGFVDVWDTVLVRNLQAQQQLAILPSCSLVKNIGSDSNATHTKDSQWTNLPSGQYQATNTKPTFSKEVDYWLRQNFFNIGIRHLLSTRVTALLDRFSRSPREPLLKRWVENQIIDL